MKRTALKSALAAFVTVGCAALLPAAAQASSDTPHFDARQQHQAARIERGVGNGTLTRREAARLDHGQQHLQRLEDRVKSDGVVTHRERAHLVHAAELQSRRIHHHSHDRQHDFDHDGRLDRHHHWDRHGRFEHSGHHGR